MKKKRCYLLSETSEVIRVLRPVPIRGREGWKGRLQGDG